MILVSFDHLLDLQQVVLQQLRDRWGLEEVCILAHTGDRKVVRRAHHTDSGNFIDDQEAFFICKPIPFLGIRIMAGAEAVGIRPLHAFKVALDQRQIKAAADDIEILMLAIAFQIDR